MALFVKIQLIVSGIVMFPINAIFAFIEGIIFCVHDKRSGLEIDFLENMKIACWGLIHSFTLYSAVNTDDIMAFGKMGLDVINKKDEVE